ncbi:MAG: hypothetical protein QM718_07790 [Steroidobacteraceae bacterium]
METPFAIYDALSALDIPAEKVRVVVQSMERDMALFATRSQFSALDEHSGARFELLRAEIAATRERIETFNERFRQVDQQFGLVAGRFEQIDRRFEQVNERFEQVDQRFEQVDRRFDRLDSRLGQLHVEMLAMERRIEQRLTIRMGSFLAVAVAVTATLVTLLRG